MKKRKAKNLRPTKRHALRREARKKQYKKLETKIKKEILDAAKGGIKLVDPTVKEPNRISQKTIRKLERWVPQIDTSGSVQTIPAILPSEDDVIINNFREDVDEFISAPFHDVMISWLDGVINRYGKNRVAAMIVAGAEAGYVITWEVLYKEEAYIEFITGIIRYMPDISQLERDYYSDASDEFSFNFDYFEEGYE